MARYIDAYSLSNKVFESKKNNPHLIDVVKRSHNCEHEHFLKLIADEPTADVVEVKHGAWIWKENDCACSVCGEEGGKKHHYEDGTVEKHSYCPNCGAKMDKKEGIEE